MSSFNLDSLVESLNNSGSDDDELSSLDFKSLKKDSKKKRPKGRRGLEGPKKSIAKGPKKSIGKGPRKSIGKQTRCCKCHYIKRNGALRKVRGPYSSCSYEGVNCCKDKKTIVKKKKKKNKKKSKRKTARR